MKYVPFQVRLNKQVRARLDATAAAHGRSRSAVIREAVEQYLDTHDVAVDQDGTSDLTGSRGT